MEKIKSHAEIAIIINKDYSVEKNILLSARGLPEFDQLLILSEFKPIFIDAYLKLTNDQKSSDQVISELIKKNTTIIKRTRNLR